jgi:hypothetical protein
MNEKIKELAEQAVEQVSAKRTLTDGQVERTWNPDYFNQAFAELIVKECEKVSLKNSHRDDDMGAIIARQIKQHFGVEE